MEDIKQDKEALVYSRPTHEWSYKAIYKSFVFECPDTARYKVPDDIEWMTFRIKGGLMKKLYRIEERLTMNLKKDYISFVQNEEIPKEKRLRVIKYIETMRKNIVIKKEAELLEQKQIFLFSSESIYLPNHPKAAGRNNSYSCYYKLGDLMELSEVEPVKH